MRPKATVKALLNSESDRTLGNHGVVHWRSKGLVQYKLHDTYIITVDTVGKRFVSNNGGWATPTTNNAINEYTDKLRVQGLKPLSLWMEQIDDFNEEIQRKTDKIQRMNRPTKTPRKAEKIEEYQKLTYELQEDIEDIKGFIKDLEDKLEPHKDFIKEHTRITR